MPDRSLLPSLSKYSYKEYGRITGKNKIVGNAENTRGCRYACLYCSVFAANRGRSSRIPSEIVLADVRNLLEMGAEHICFVDAEFLNDVEHTELLTSKLHQEFPSLTFDVTTRVDHFLEHPDLIKRLRDRGCVFITSALEFPDDRFLRAMNKQLTVQEIRDGVKFCKENGIVLNPTFITFNPWMQLEDMEGFTRFLDETGLKDMVDPLQLETRLYLYKGSPLLNVPFVKGLKLEEREFKYDWKHEDARVDELFSKASTPVEAGTFKRCCIKC